MFEQKLSRMGYEFSLVVWQHERVYLPSDFRPNMNYPRLVMRTEVRATEQPATYTMFLKRHIEDSGVDVIHDTRVENYTEATAMIHQLGFRKAAEISRRRQETRLDDKTVLYIDEVDGIIGVFLKIEAEVVEGEAVDALRRDLFGLLRALGQDRFLMQAYYNLMNEEPEFFWLPE